MLSPNGVHVDPSGETHLPLNAQAPETKDSPPDEAEPKDPFEGVPLGIPHDPWLSLKIIRWARTTGPRLGKVHRAILIDLAAYCDADGIATPSQETIAYNIDASRGGVIAALKDLDALGLLRRWNRADSEGNHKNAYQLMGHFNGWMPFYQEEDASKPIVSMLCDRIKDKDAENHDLRSFIKEAGLEEDFVKRHPDGHEGSRSNTPIYKTNGRDNYDNGSSNVIPDDISLEKLELRREIAAWVESQWHDRLSKTWKKTKATAIRWYLAHPDGPDGYREQRREQEAEVLKERAAPATSTVEIDPSIDADPAVAAIWEEVLWQLEERFPRHVTEPWMKGKTTGWSLNDETLLVLCETRMVADHLEVRYYQSIYREVEKVLGREVDVQLGFFR